MNECGAAGAGNTRRLPTYQHHFVAEYKEASSELLTAPKQAQSNRVEHHGCYKHRRWSVSVGFESIRGFTADMISLGKTPIVRVNKQTR